MLYNFRVVFRFLSYAVFMLCRSIMTPCLIIYHQVVTTRNLFCPNLLQFPFAAINFLLLAVSPNAIIYIWFKPPAICMSHSSHRYTHTGTLTPTHTEPTTHDCANYKMPRRLPSGSVLWHIYGPNGLHSAVGSLQLQPLIFSSHFFHSS